MHKRLRNIGIIETYKITFLIIILVINIPLLIRLIRQVFNGNVDFDKIDIIGYYSYIFSSISSSIGLLLVQLIIIGILILIVGPIASRQIILKKKNSFFICTMLFLTLWTTELIFGDVCVGISNYLKFHDEYYLQKIFNWNYVEVFDMTIKVIFPSSLIAGILLGWQIKKHSHMTSTK